LRNFNCLSPDEQLARFYLLWTAKEALLKAIGCGLMIHPGQINVEEIYSEKKLTIEDRSNLIELPAITLAKLSISEGYAAWMAYIGESARIACYLLTQNLVSM
jgi:phosphopantetheinyl transferase